jgi:hypothetical protein
VLPHRALERCAIDDTNRSVLTRANIRRAHTTEKRSDLADHGANTDGTEHRRATLPACSGYRNVQDAPLYEAQCGGQITFAIQKLVAHNASGLAMPCQRRCDNALRRFY